MINTNNPEINVEELMQRIRAEVAQRKAASSKAESQVAVEKPRFSAGVENTSGEELPAFTLNLPKLSSFAVQPVFQSKSDGQYHVNDLLCYHDQAFVTIAYCTVLRRSPDTDGYLHYLNMLRNGCAKVDILGRLRYSKEGRATGIKISGLALPFLLQQVYRIPVFGRFVQILSAIWHLPHLERNQRTFENHTILLMEQAQSHFSESCRSLNQSLVQLEQGIRQLQDFAAPRADQAAINEANVAHFSLIQKSVEELQNSKAGLDSIELIKSHIQNLQNSKANQDDLKTAIEKMQLSIQDSVLELQNSKAGLDSIELIKGHIQNLQNSKANQDDLNTAIEKMQLSIQDSVLELQNSKAGLDSIELIKGHIQELQNFKAAHSAFEAEQRQTRSTLDALQQNVQQVLNAAKNLQDSKANQSALDEALLSVKAQTHDIKRNLLDQDRRLGLLLEEARKRLPEPISTEQIETMLTEDDHRLDAMYASFEERFRGTREDIKQRQSIYLPIVLEAKAGTKGAPILDLGCGRGEWLEFLARRGPHRQRSRYQPHLSGRMPRA